MAQEIFCPNCFARISVSANICSACGERIAALNERGNAEKLIPALNYPLADIRMRAIIALGLRVEERAACAIRICLVQAG